MIVWRTSKTKYASSSFSGIGAVKVGGRFNSIGSPPVVYTACDSLALALLEVLVHLPNRRTPPDFSYIKAEVPKSVSREIPTRHASLGMNGYLGNLAVYCLFLRR